MGKIQDKNEATLRAAAVASGWTEDRFGNLKTTVTRPAKGLPEKTVEVYYRLHFQAVSVRLERGPSPSWMKVGGCYLRDVQVLESGAVQFGRHRIGAGERLGVVSKEVPCAAPTGS